MYFIYSFVLSAAALLSCVSGSAEAKEVRAAGVYAPDLPRNADAALTTAPLMLRSLLLDRQPSLQTLTWSYPPEATTAGAKARSAVIIVPRDSDHPEPTTVTVPLTIKPKVASAFPRNPQFSCAPIFDRCDCSPRASGCSVTTTYTFTATITRDTDRPCDLDPSNQSLCKMALKTEAPAVTVTATPKL